MLKIIKTAIRKSVARRFLNKTVFLVKFLLMKKIYIFFVLLVFRSLLAQNKEIKDLSGTLLAPTFDYCASTVLNLQVSDYYSAGSSTSATLPIGTFNYILNDTTGEKDVDFSAPAGTYNMFSLPIDLGFNFSFYNNIYTKVVVGSNGRLVFTNDPVLNSLNNTSQFIDRYHVSPPVTLASPLYNRVYKTGDLTREIKMAQIFAGYTRLRINTTTGKYKYKNFDTGTEKGILITFQSVVPHDGTGTDLGPIYTSRIILFEDGRVVINVKDKTTRSYNAILGMQNEDGTLAIVPKHSTVGQDYNNGSWISESGNAFVYTTGSPRTPTYLWELDRDNDGTVDETSSTRFFPNYSPVSDVEKLSVRISFAETSEVKTSEVIFKKIKVPVIEGILHCSYEMRVTPATYDPAFRYTWYKDGTTAPVAIGQTFSIHRTVGTAGNYYVKMSKADGSPLCLGSDESNRLTYDKQRFPALIAYNYCITDNTSTPLPAKTVNLYDIFYPKYDPASGLEPYQIVFSSTGGVISATDAENFVVPANKELNLNFAVKEATGTYSCYTGSLPLYYLSMPPTKTITICSSVTTYNLKSVFEDPSYPMVYYYYYTYVDDGSIADGSAIDVTRKVNVKTIATGAGSCITNTVVDFAYSTTVTLPLVPMQERCAGSDTNANRFDFNLIKNTLDPSDQYDVKFYKKSDDSEIVIGPGPGENLNAAGYFWSDTTGDYIIYAKVIDRTDPTCFAISADIILRVYIRPSPKTNYQNFMSRNACGISRVDLTIHNIFDVINPVVSGQIPTVNYYDQSGTEVIDITDYDIARGIPYLLIQNGNCLPPVRLNYTIISEPLPVTNPGPETLCDDFDGNPDGKVKVRIASNEYKSKFTPDYSTATFKFYDGTILIHTSSSINDLFEYEVTDAKTISVIISNEKYCENVSEIAFNIKTPTAIVMTGDTNLCYNENLNILLQNFSDFSIIKLIDPDNVETKIIKDIAIPYSDVQFERTYKLLAINLDGCISEISFIASSQNQPKIDVVNQTSNSIEVVASGGAQPYRYYFNGAMQTSNTLQNPTAPYYEIQVQSATGCFGPPKTVYFIKINNAFTPNGDGKNDVWKIENLDKMENVSLVIVDRFGNKVFESQNKDKVEWDGTSGGRKVPSSTYWYTLTFYDAVTQKAEQRQGWILLKNRN